MIRGDLNAFTFTIGSVPCGKYVIKVTGFSGDVGSANFIVTYPCPTISVAGTYSQASCTGTLTITANNVNLICNTGSKITDQRTNGIYLSGVSNVNVIDCYVTGFTGSGILVGGGSENTLTGNTATKNTSDGFALISSASGNNMVNNTANNNSYVFLLDSSTSANVAVGNSARGNPTSNADDADANNFQASLNPGIVCPTFTLP